MEDPDIPPHDAVCCPPCHSHQHAERYTAYPRKEVLSATRGSRYIDEQDHTHYHSQPQQHYHHHIQLLGPGTKTTPWPDRSLPPPHTSAKVNSQETK